MKFQNEEYEYKKFKIRKATVEDIDSLIMFHTTSWENSYSDFFSKNFIKNLKSKKNLDKKRKNFENDIQHNKFIEIFIAESENKIIGLLILSYSSINNISYGEIKALYVLSNLKYQGIGSKLLEHGIKIFKKKKCRCIFLWVLEKNITARNFYEKKFFVNTKERQNFSDENVSVIKYLLKFNERNI